MHDSTVASNERDRCRRIAHDSGVCPCCGWETTAKLQKRERRGYAANDVLRRKAEVLRVSAVPRESDWWLNGVMRLEQAHPKKTREECEQMLIHALTPDESEAYSDTPSRVVTEDDLAFLVMMATRAPRFSDEDAERVDRLGDIYKPST